VIIEHLEFETAGMVGYDRLYSCGITTKQKYLQLNDSGREGVRVGGREI